MEKYFVQLRNIFNSFSGQYNLSDAIYLSIIEGINQNIFPVGHVLNSNLLEEVFQVSRTPVHTALVRLEDAEMIRHNSRNSYKTYRFTFEERKDYNDCMLGLYELAAIFLHGEISPYYKLKLDKQIKNLEDAFNDNFLYLENDFAFHKEIMMCTGNSELIKIYNRHNLKKALFYFDQKVSMKYTPGFAKAHHPANVKIYDTLINGSAADVRQACFEHYNNYQEFLYIWLSMHND